MLRFGRYLCLLLIPMVLMAMISACAIPLQPVKAVAPATNESAVATEDLTTGSFVERLRVALVERDYSGLQGMMGNSFGLAQWGADGGETGVERPPAIALLTLRERYLGAGSAPVFPDDADLDILFADVVLDSLWDQPLALADTLYITGLGTDQRGEALLLIAHNADEALYWRGILVAPGGFAMSETTVDATMLNAPLVVSSIAQLSATPPITSMAAISLTAALVPIPAAKVDAMPAAPARIEIPLDAPEQRLRGVLQAAQSRLYILHGAEGQAVTVALASNSDLANFSITGIDDGQPYKRLGDDARRWQETLPTTQDYLITVASTVALPFELTISTDATALSAATSAATTATP